MYDILNQDRFAAAVLQFELACRTSREHASFAQRMLAKYGDHGPDVSGCVRDHFPDHVKDTLRTAARRVTEYSTAGHAARPKYVRPSTMVQLAQSVATRDGSGFYGPQPYTSQTMAAALAARTRSLAAWNHTPTELANIVRGRRNGAGLRLTFADGSAAFIPAGTADVRVVS